MASISRYDFTDLQISVLGNYQRRYEDLQDFLNRMRAHQFDDFAPMMVSVAQRRDIGFIRTLQFEPESTPSIELTGTWFLAVDSEGETRVDFSRRPDNTLFCAGYISSERIRRLLTDESKNRFDSYINDILEQNHARIEIFQDSDLIERYLTWRKANARSAHI